MILKLLIILCFIIIKNLVVKGISVEEYFETPYVKASNFNEIKAIETVI